MRDFRNRFDMILTEAKQCGNFSYGRKKNNIFITTSILRKLYFWDKKTLNIKRFYQYMTKLLFVFKQKKNSLY